MPAILRRPKPHTIKTPRRLVLRRARAIWEAHPNNAKPKNFVRTGPNGEVVPDPDPEKLPVGYEQLNSYYKPSLTANSSGKPNTINVTQTITTKDGTQSLPLTSEQDFVVIAPRYSLPAGDIHSTYPPQGHGDKVPILPHVVFNDAHLPWEREVTKVKAPDHDRNLVPWLALLVFTQDELRLSPAQLAGPQKIFPHDVTQSTTLSVNMSIDDLYQMKPGSIITPVPKDGDSATNADFIFVPTKLFQDHVTTYNLDGTPSASQTGPDVQPYKFLAHTRAVHTDGMANAGIEAEVGLFSVVVAHRAGPWTITTATPLVVHLVSIDGVEDNLEGWPLSGGDYVALCSLYSWTYQCLPPKSLDIADALEQLGKGLNVLRIAETVYKHLLNDPQSPLSRIGQRLKDGYTLTRYRLQTGEETVALYRGPFTPTNVPYTTSPGNEHLRTQSMFSTDLQVLDQRVGIMDITYSVAWQLGKTLAMADQPFTTALSRLRRSIHDTALQNSKANALGNTHRTAQQVLTNFREKFDQLAVLPSKGTSQPNLRWRREWAKTPLDLSFWSPAVRDSFLQEAIKAAVALAQSTTQGSFYNEHNTPVSSDWAVMLNWILDKMSLIGVPAHYFIPEPTSLPRESLRFFAIDRAWIDALIDGALSLANHLEQDDDIIRTAIKTAINQFLDTTDPIIGYKPQIPTFGFLLRSEVVQKFPDLVVEAPRRKGDERAPLLRHENIDSEVMLVLLDRAPGDNPADLTQLTLTQPPHQQRFAAAAAVGPEPDLQPPSPTPIFELHYRRIFTVENVPPEERIKECGPPQTWTMGVTMDPPIQVFDFDSRLIRTQNFAQQIYNNLLANMPPGDFTDTVPTAAMCAFQLNDPMYQVEVDFSNAVTQEALASLVGGKGEETSVVLKMLERRDRSKMAEKHKVHRKTVAVLSKLASQSFATMSLPPDTQGAKDYGKPRGPDPAPHFRRIPRFIGTSPPPSSTVTAYEADKPHFKYAVYPLSAPKPFGPVPTQSGIAQDLVFSVVLPPDQRNVGFFQLQELRIIVPLGTYIPSKRQRRTYLTADYIGPGLSMLSNLRFNVLGEYYKDQAEEEWMYLRLLPRSTQGYIPIQNIAEASFLWTLVVIQPYTQEDLFVQCNVEEYYVGHEKPYTTPFRIYLTPDN